MKYIFAFLALLLVSLPALPLQAAENAPASAEAHQAHESFARDFATKVLAILQDQKKSFDDRKDILRQAFSNSVDIDWIARFVLGHSWNQATDEQKQRYTALYRKYLTETYVSNFAENPDRRISDIKIFNVNDGDDNRFTVNTGMRLADRENLNVSYLVSDYGHHYKVLDIVIENVSLIATHRAEFTQLADTRGIDGVIAKLQELTSKPAALTLSMNERQ